MSLHARASKTNISAIEEALLLSTLRHFSRDVFFDYSSLMGFWRRKIIIVVIAVTVGLSLGILNVVDKGVETYLRWAETRGVPSWVSSVVEIRTGDAERDYRASGVILRTRYVKHEKKWHTYILTAAHVVLGEADSTDTAHPGRQDETRCKGGPSEGAIEPKIRALGEEAELLKYDTDVDLALLKIVTPAYPQLLLQEQFVDVQPVTLSAHIPKPAEEVWAIGFPDKRMITRGYVGAYFEAEDGGVLFHSAPARPGSSGGGVFQDDKLIGINVGVDCDSTGHPDVVPVMAIGGRCYVLDCRGVAITGFSVSRDRGKGWML